MKRINLAKLPESEKAAIRQRNQRIADTTSKQGSNLERCVSCGKKITYDASGNINHKCSESHERAKQAANRRAME